MYKLYSEVMSGAVAPQAALEEIGAEYEKIPIDMANEEHKKPEYLAINPMGHVPTLVLPDDTVVAESAAIMITLGDRHPESGLIPKLGRPERSTFYRWVIFMATNNYATIARVNHPERYTTEETGIDGVRAAAVRELDRQFKVLNNALEPGPYLLGRDYSGLDIYLCMVASFHSEPERMYTENPRVRALCERVFKRPAIAKVWAEHNLVV